MGHRSIAAPSLAPICTSTALRARAGRCDQCAAAREITPSCAAPPRPRPTVARQPACPFAHRTLFNMESGTSIKHKAAGSGGLPELIGHLEEKAVQYAIFAVENPKGEPRYVLMTWIGPNVSKIKKSKTAANHDGVLVLSGARPAPPRPRPPSRRRAMSSVG